VSGNRWLFADSRSRLAREIHEPTGPRGTSADPETARIVTTRIGVEEFRRVLAGISLQRLGFDRVERRGTPPALEEDYRMPEPPAQRGERPQSVLHPQPIIKSEFRLAGQVLGIVAVLALSFLVELTVLGNLRHDHDQAQLAADFRIELANGTGPVGPLDDANKVLAAGAPVALLEIRSLGLHEVVVEGTSSGTLMSGPGHRRDTPLPGQVGTSVITGRRATYGGPFGSINQLRAGDQITATTGQGKHSFKVLDVRHAGDPLPPTLTRGQGRLVLVTTDGPALQPTDVLRVDAALVSAAQSRAAQLPSAALPAADALMAGDTSTLLSIVGWAILLVAAAVATVWVRFSIGLWQAWVIGLPVLVALGLTASDDIAALLPNLL
jgi:LPXTG-site transpeptidase (sortase) family protein